MRIFHALMLATTSLIAIQASAHEIDLGASIYWTDWTSVSPGNPGSASGSITAGGATLAVSYSGQLRNGVCSESSWGNFPPYPSSSECLLVESGIQNRITFSQPVVNPTIKFASYSFRGFTPQTGYYIVSSDWTFDADFTLFPFFPSGEFGSVFEKRAGNVLYGYGWGAIQFGGTYTSIGWSVASPETWNGDKFTVGIGGISQGSGAVPEPGTLATLGGAAALLLAMRRRRR